MNMFMIVGSDVTDGECDVEVGVVESEELAQRIVEKLNADNKEARRLWENFGSRCQVGCDAFKSSSDSEAVKSLNECREFECPYKRNIHLDEIFYGGGDHGEETSGGFEVVCDGKRMWCNCPFDYSYSYHKVPVISESAVTTIVEENML